MDIREIVYQIQSGSSDRQISRDLEIDRRTVKRYREWAQEEGLLAFIRQGGGFFGLHTADASFRDRKGYHAMLNGFFNGHSKYMDFTVQIVDPDHPIAAGLSDFEVTDELHYLKHDPARSHHLMQAYDPTKDETHVMAFTHTYGDGRVFFFALGHDMAVLENPAFQEVLLRGVLWAGQRL